MGRGVLLDVDAALDAVVGVDDVGLGCGDAVADDLGFFGRGGVQFPGHTQWLPAYTESQHQHD